MAGGLKQSNLELELELDLNPVVGMRSWIARVMLKRWVSIVMKRSAVEGGGRDDMSRMSELSRRGKNVLSKKMTVEPTKK